MAERRKLSDILHGSERDELAKAFGKTKTAEDFAPLPNGEYVAHVVEGTFDTTRTGKPEYRLTFRVADGEYAGRPFWHHCYLTPDAMPFAKKDLAKLGITSLDQLDNPLPAGIRCKVKLVLQRDDNGNEQNKVRRFEVVGIDKPEPDAFAPADPVEGDPPAGLPTGPSRNGEGKALLPFGANGAANGAGAGPYSEGF